MSVDLGAVAASAAAFAVIAASPGPATLSLAATSMAGGARAGVPWALGLAAGLTVWGAAVAVGLGALVTASPPALFALKILGGLYLLHLAWRSVQAALSSAEAARPAAAEAPPGRLFRRAAALNLLNPKAAVAWAAVLALGAPTGEGATAAQLTLAAAVCIALAYVVNVGYALLFSLPPARRAYARAGRGIEGVAGAVFAAFGLSLLYDALRRSPGADAAA
ncbi:MAG: LysE family translocator [Pseudomonadota bacterium]